MNVSPSHVIGWTFCLSLHKQGWETPALPVKSVPLLNQWWAESTDSSQIHMELNIPIVIGVRSVKPNKKKILHMNTSVQINRPKLNGISLFIFPNWLKVKFEWWNAQRQAALFLTVFLIQTLKELKITARRDGRSAARNIEFFKKNIHEKTHRRRAGPLCASTVAASQYQDRPSLFLFFVINTETLSAIG